MGLGDTLAFLVTADGAQAIGELGRVAAAAKAAGEEASGAGGGLGSIGGAAITAGIGVAGATIAKFAQDGINSYVNLTEAVRKFADTSGASAEQSSKLLYSAKALGVDTEALSTSLFRLGANAETKPAQFDKFGVAIAHAKDGTIDLYATFGNLLNRMHELGSGAESDALAKALIGRGATTVAPLAAQYDELAKLGKQAQQNGGVVTDADLHKAQQYKESVTGLTTEVSHLERELGGALIPTVTSFTNILDGGVRDLDNWTKKVGGLSNIIASGLAGLIPGGALIKAFSGHVKDTAQAQQDGTSAAGTWAAAQKQAADDAAAAATAADKEAAAVRGARDAAIAMVDADKAVRDAEAAVATAREAANQKTIDITRATQGYEDAVRSVSAAETALADAEALALEKPLRDTLALHSATFAVTDAVKAHALAVEQYGANSEEAAKAADAITTAQLNQADTRRKASEPDPSVENAKVNLAKANDSVAVAQQAINKAENEDPAKVLADAEDNLARAVNGQADAQDRAKKAITDSIVVTGDLKASFDKLIDKMVAAGVDPATVQVFRNIESAALAARASIDGSGPDYNSGTDSSHSQAFAPYDSIGGGRRSSSSVTPNSQIPSALEQFRTQVPQMVDNSVKVYVNNPGASAQDIAGAIAFAQATVR